MINSKPPHILHHLPNVLLVFTFLWVDLNRNHNTLSNNLRTNPHQSPDFLQDGQQVLYFTGVESRVLSVADKVCQVIFSGVDLGLDHLCEGWFEHFQLLACEVATLQ
jgi:hypothetical protein